MSSSKRQHEEDEEVAELNDNDTVKYGMMKEWFQSMGEEVAEVERRTQSFRMALMGVVLFCFMLSAISIALSTSASSKVSIANEKLTMGGQRFVELGTPKGKGGCVPVLSCDTRKVHSEQTSSSYDNHKKERKEL